MFCCVFRHLAFTKVLGYAGCHFLHSVSTVWLLNFKGLKFCDFKNIPIFKNFEGVKFRVELFVVLQSRSSVLCHLYNVINPYGFYD